MSVDTTKVVTSVTLDRTLVARLDAFAGMADRSRSWMVQCALGEFLARRAAADPSVHAAIVDGVNENLAVDLPPRSDRHAGCALRAGDAVSRTVPDSPSS